MNDVQFKTLDVVLTNEDYQRARIYADVRKVCSNFLDRYGIKYKSSTGFRLAEINHDYYRWCIAAITLKKYLSKDKNIEIKIWEDNFNIQKILEILIKKSSIEKDVNYINSYICNKYHIRITSTIGIGEQIFDIRTALTQKTPQSNWNFLFPADKARLRNNNTILLYCIGNKNYTNKIVFSGIISHDTIKQCPILKKGQATKFGTVNQIDGYITTLNRHYIY